MIPAKRLSQSILRPGGLRETLFFHYPAANIGRIRAEEHVHLMNGADSRASRSDLIDLHLY